MSMSNKKSNLRDFASRAKKLKKIIDDNFNLSFVKISKNLNLGEEMKKSTFRASASRAKNESKFGCPPMDFEIWIHLYASTT
jgi:hypothetical protein